MEKTRKSIEKGLDKVSFENLQSKKFFKSYIMGAAGLFLASLVFLALSLIPNIIFQTIAAIMLFLDFPI